MSKPIGFKFGKPVDDYSRTAAETELENTNEIFKLLIDAVDEYAIFALDLDGRVLTWNAGAQRLKGYAADEVVGTHFSRFYECADIKRGHPQHELEIASSQGKYEEEGWRIKKDGSRFWANVVITALRDPSGELRGYGKVTRDLTAKREAELKLRESEERFRMLVSSVTDYAVMSLDVDGRITSWNMGAQRITGYEAREILGAHVSKFYTPADLKAKKIETELKTARETGRYEEVGERVRKNGEIYWANVVINAIRDEFGEVVGFSKITRDITESKIAAEKLRESEEKLRSAYAGLEVKITERTQQLIEAKEKAEIAVKARDEFFSMASHELKTPLSALKMQTQIRQRSVKKGNLKDFATPDAILERCAEDERQVDRLTFLVDNMLDVSRLTSGNFTLSFENVDLKELVEDVAHRLEPILKESGNTLTVETPDQVTGVWDRHRLEQVLTNLLSNAGRYAPGTPVDLQLKGTRNGVSITVRDRGVGIAKADQSRIFSPFERVKDKLNASGLGLGLYITKQIVDAHCGQIEIESDSGKGATFKVNLPLNSRPQGEEGMH